MDRTLARLAFLGLLAALVPAPGPAAPPALRSFRLGRLQGRVEILALRGAWALATPGRELPPGATLRVGPGGRAELFAAGPGTRRPPTLRLGSATELRVVEEPLDADLKLVTGVVEVPATGTGTPLRVQLGAAVATTAGSAILRVTPGSQGPRAWVAALAGSARAAIPRGATRTLPEGQELFLPPGGPSLWRAHSLSSREALARVRLVAF